MSKAQKTRVYAVKIRLAEVIKVRAISRKDAEAQVMCWSDSKILDELDQGWEVECLCEL